MVRGTAFVLSFIKVAIFDIFISRVFQVIIVLVVESFHSKFFGLILIELFLRSLL